MRKLLAICICLFIGATASAQLTPGSKIIKGSFGFNSIGNIPYDDGSTSDISSSLNLFTFNPEFEYFCSERVSVGVSVGYMNLWTLSKSSSAFSNSKSKDGINLYYVGPTFNYYIPLANRFYLSFNCFLGYAGLNQNSVYESSYGEESEGSSGNAGMLTVTPTLNYFINDKWLMTASIGNLNAMCGKMEDAEATMYSAGINWGQITLGVGFKF